LGTNLYHTAPNKIIRC